MTAMRIAFRLVIALVGCPAACATVPVGRPPSVGEIATINGEAARGRGLAVEPPLVVASGAGCGSISSSCDDIGSVTFALSATDDRTPVATMGFRITASGSRSLEGLYPLDMDVRLFDGKMAVRWLDGATDDQESLDFDLEVRAIDLAGNVSPEPAIVRVRQDPGGCRIGRGSAANGDSLGTVALALAALAMAVRRRRPA